MVNEKIHIQKISIMQRRMSRYIYVKIKKDIIINECIWKHLVARISDKLKETWKCELYSHLDLETWTLQVIDQFSSI